MRLDAWQRRAIFDLICWIIVAAVLMCVIGSFVGCATGTSKRAPALAAPTPPTLAQRVEPTIIRTGQHRCGIVVGPGAAWYEQAGTVRPVWATFACPAVGKARERWGSGTRLIVIQYADGRRERVVEFWPEERKWTKKPTTKNRSR